MNIPELSVIFTFFLLTSSFLTQAWTLTGSHDAVQSVSILPSRELDAAFEKAAAKGPLIHTKAREFVRSLDNAASCVRTAAFGLIRDCSSLESKPAEEHVALDSVKILYAARLAVCELQDAGLPIPSQCSLDVIGRDRSGFLAIRSEPQRAVSSCVKALEARPQSWTSYSNSRQNALLICQAARPEAEREGMLAMFKSLVENNAASEEVLHEQIVFSRKQLAEQRALATELQKFAANVKTEMAAGLESAVMAFEKLKTQAGAAETEVLRMFTNIMEQAKGDMQVLFEAILQQKSALQDANAEINGLVSGLSTQGHAISAQWRNDIETNLMLVSQAQSGLADLSLQHGHLHQNVKEMQDSAASTALEQLQAQQDIRLGSQETIAAFTALQASAIEITTALEDVSVYAGFISSLAQSFDAVFKWLLAGLAVVFVSISVLVFGRRGLIMASMTVISTVLCANRAKFYQGLSHQMPCIAPLLAANSYSAMSILNVFLAVAAFVLLATSARQYFGALERDLVVQSHRDAEEGSIAGSKFRPDFIARASTPELCFHYYDPTTDDFTPTAPS